MQTPRLGLDHPASLNVHPRWASSTVQSRDVIGVRLLHMILMHDREAQQTCNKTTPGVLVEGCVGRAVYGAIEILTDVQVLLRDLWGNIHVVALSAV